MKIPLVSVLMITFNHEKFIKEALESIICQKTNFEFQIVLCDDCSSDNTPTICNEYKDKYPDLITLVLNPQNMGGNGMPNLMNGYSKYCTKSKYLAICEGDDYWTSPDKLQKQVNFMETNPEFALTFHNAEVISFEGVHSSYLLNSGIEKDVFSLNDLIGEDEIWFMATASILYRRQALGDLPAWLHDSLSGDIPMHILAARNGKIKYLDEPMSVYRKNLGGTSFTDNKKDEKFLRNRIFMYSKLNDETNRVFNKRFRKNISRYYLMMLDCEQFKGKKISLALFALKYLNMARPSWSERKEIIKKYLLPDFLLILKRRILNLLNPST
jgi:glycosyltransferase involved in cell wall biosynthesis